MLKQVCDLKQYLISLDEKTKIRLLTDYPLALCQLSEPNFNHDRSL